MNPSLPVHPIHRFLQKHYDGEISHETTFLLKQYVEEIIDAMAEETVESFKEANKERKLQGLQPIKRLDAHSLNKARDKLYNSGPDSNKRGADEW